MFEKSRVVSGLPQEQNFHVLNLKHFKSLKIPKRKSEAINRRGVDNTLVKRKRKQELIEATIY
jgi:hypothetical protein